VRCSSIHSPAILAKPDLGKFLPLRTETRSDSVHLALLSNDTCNVRLKNSIAHHFSRSRPKEETSTSRGHTQLPTRKQ